MTTRSLERTRGRAARWPWLGFLVWIGCVCPAAGADYYVSPSGDDARPGNTPSQAWRSLAKVNDFAFAPGDCVHFARGGTWRGQLVPHGGSPQGSVTYTSYGDGPKPLLLGSLEKDDPQGWEQVETNRWRAGPFPCDVGNIIFDGGRACGVKVWNASDVDGPDKFWFDQQTKTVLLHAAENPASRFNQVECALTRHIISEGGKSYVVYDGLHLAYGSAHGIGGGGTHHIIVRNCDLCFIGGGHQYSKKTPRGVRHVRYGNGIEFWSGAHDNLVEGCRIWDIYDAGLTNQGSGKNAQYNITYRNNLVWNCEYSFEYWNRPAESTTHDIHFEDNLCFHAGGGWSHAQRPWPAGVHLMFFSNQAKTGRFFVRRNVFHGAENSAINIHVAQWNGLEGLLLSENTYCQPPESVLVRWGDTPFTAARFADYQRTTHKDEDSRLVALGGLTLEPADVVLRTGAEQPLRATARYTSGATWDVTPIVRYVSSDDSVTTVSRQGVVRGVRPGKVKVAATLDGREAEVSVAVRP